jgi:drug/metabolite transporter (DMT)-like permease
MSSHPAPRAPVVFAFLCVYLCWGMTYGAIAIAVRHLAPPLVGAIRTSASMLIFVGICRARRVSLRVPRDTAWKLALMGVLIMSGNNVLLIWAESMVPSGWASVVIAMIPVLIALMETVLPDGDRLNALGWTGTTAGTVGILALLWPSLHRSLDGLAAAGDARTLLGFAILAVAALSFAVGSVLGRRFRLRVDTFVATGWQVAAATVVNGAIAIGGGTLKTAQFTPSGLAAIGFLAVFGTVVGLTAYTYLLQHVAVTKVATYAFVNPVIAVLIGGLFFGERLRRPEILSVALILAGVATVILSRTRREAVQGGAPTLEAEA